MAKGISGAGLRQELAVRIRSTLRNHYDAVTERRDRLLYALQKAVLVEGDLGKQDDVRRLGCLTAGQARRGSDPAGMPTHDLEHKYLGRRSRHGGDIERRLASRYGDVLGDRPEPWAAVRVRQVVVDGLRHADAGDRIPQRLADLRDLEGRVHGVVAAVVEEITDVVGAENLDQPLVFRAVLLEALQLEPCRAEGPGWRMPEPADDRGILTADIDQILCQRADDAIASRVDFADVSRLPHCRLDDAAGRGIDDGRHSAGLGVERVLLGRRFFHGVAGPEGGPRMSKQERERIAHGRAFDLAAGRR